MAGTEVGRIYVKVSPDTDGFRRALERQLKAATKGLNPSVPVDIDFDGSQTKAKMRALLAELQAQAKANSPKIRPDVEVSALQRMQQGLSGLGNGSSEAASGLLSVGRTGLLVGAVFAAAAPAVGLVAGIIAGLPSLMLGVAAAGGAIALGLDGIKAAAEELRPQLDGLKAAVSQRFQEGLSPIFQQLLPLFPIIQQGMLAVTDGLLSMGQAFTNALTSVQGMANLQAIMGGIGSFLTSISPAVEKFTSSFLQLGAAGANAFGYLSGFINTFADQWSSMVERITANGVFENAMKGMSTALSGFTGLFTQLMESGLGAMAKLGEPLNNMFKGLGDVLTAAMPALTSFSTFVANAIGSLGTALAPIITALTPAFSALTDVLGSQLATSLQMLSPILTQVASTLGTVMLSALTQLQPYLPQLQQAFIGLAQAVASGLAQYLPVIANGFMQMLPSIIQLVPAFTQMVSALTPLVPVFVNVAVFAAQLAARFMGMAAVTVQAGAAIAGLVANVVSFASAMAQGAVTAVTAFVDAVKTGFANVVTAVAEGIGQAVSEVQSFGSKAVAACAGFGTLLVSSGKALIQGFVDGIKSMVGAVTDAIGSVLSAARALFPFSPAKEGPFSGSGWVYYSGLSVGEGFAEGIQNSTQQVTDAAKGMVGAASAEFQKADWNKVIGERFQATIGGAKKAGEKKIDWDQKINQSLEDLTAMPVQVGMANARQAMSDLGMSGGGVLGAAMDWGTSMMSNAVQYNFHVSSVDEALAAKDREESRQGMAYVGR